MSKSPRGAWGVRRRCWPGLWKDTRKEPVFGCFLWQHGVDRVPWGKNSPIWELMVLA